jgi:hypothetical protein
MLQFLSTRRAVACSSGDERKDDASDVPCDTGQFLPKVAKSKIRMVRPKGNPTVWLRTTNCSAPGQFGGSTRLNR